MEKVYLWYEVTSSWPQLDGIYSTDQLINQAVQRPISFERSIMVGKVEGRRRRRRGPPADRGMYSVRGDGAPLEDLKDQDEGQIFLEKFCPCGGWQAISTDQSINLLKDPTPLRGPSCWEMWRPREEEDHQQQRRWTQLWWGHVERLEGPSWGQIITENIYPVCC